MIRWLIAGVFIFLGYLIHQIGDKEDILGSWLGNMMMALGILMVLWLIYPPLALIIMLGAACMGLYQFFDGIISFFKRKYTY